jgi:hypothetical protein
MRDPVPEVRTEDNNKTWDKFRTDVWAGYNEVTSLRDSVSEKFDLLPLNAPVFG